MLNLKVKHFSNIIRTIHIPIAPFVCQLFWYSCSAISCGFNLHFHDYNKVEYLCVCHVVVQYYLVPSQVCCEIFFFLFLNIDRQVFFIPYGYRHVFQISSLILSCLFTFFVISFDAQIVLILEQSKLIIVFFMGSVLFLLNTNLFYPMEMILCYYMLALLFLFHIQNCDLPIISDKVTFLKHIFIYVVKVSFFYIEEPLFWSQFYVCLFNLFYSFLSVILPIPTAILY